MMQKEQKLIQEEAQQAVLQAAASQPATMAGAHAGQAAADSSTAAPAKVGCTLICRHQQQHACRRDPAASVWGFEHCACTTHYPQPAFGCGAD